MPFGTCKTRFFLMSSDFSETVAHLIDIGQGATLNLLEYCGGDIPPQQPTIYLKVNLTRKNHQRIQAAALMQQKLGHFFGPVPCDIQLSQLEAVLCPGVVELGSIFDGWEGVLRFILKSRQTWAQEIMTKESVQVRPVRPLMASEATDGRIICSCKKLSCQQFLSSPPFSGANGSPYDPAL